MIKNIFILTAAIGLLVNLLSDVEVLRQNKVTVQSGDWVEHGYKVLQEIDGLKISILEAQLAGTVDNSLHEKIGSLNAMVQDIPSQMQLSHKLGKISDSDLIAKKFNPAVNILAEMASSERALLTVRKSTDAEENSKALSKALYASVFDMVLIALFLAFFLYERRSYLRIHNRLIATLFDVESNNRKLHDALIKKSNQLKTTVYDLKNPLGSIRGFAELMTEETGGQGAISEMASMIQKVSNNSLTLVSALLNEFGGEPIPKESLNISECLSEACDFLQPTAQSKNQKIHFENISYNSTLVGHKHQVLDLFFNIIGNALKFSPKGSEISVSCRNKNGGCEVQIKDAGPGFAQDDFPKLFRPSVTLSAKPTGEETSHGLGLFSAKAIVDELGGSIYITNAKEGGACVNITFPIKSIPIGIQSKSLRTNEDMI